MPESQPGKKDLEEDREEEGNCGRKPTNFIVEWLLHNTWRLTIPRRPAVNPPRQACAQGWPRGRTDARSARLCRGRAEEDGLCTWEAGGSAAATRGCLVPDVPAEQDTAVPADVQNQQSSGPSAGAVRRPHSDSRPAAPRLPSFWPSAFEKAKRVTERGLETAKRSLL